MFKCSNVHWHHFSTCRCARTLLYKGLAHCFIICRQYINWKLSFVHVVVPKRSIPFFFHQFIPIIRQDYPDSSIASSRHYLYFITCRITSNQKCSHVLLHSWYCHYFIRHSFYLWIPHWRFCQLRFLSATYTLLITAEWELIRVNPAARVSIIVCKSTLV